MPGIYHPPLNDISRISADLRDRNQEGYPIIKELLQNADDAEASFLHLGWFPGFSRSAHPLLTGPALFVVNNGKFTATDQKGIRTIGISTKASDATTIGKFGLGLKSVFHLCEAFFYLWSEHDTIEILNPWYRKAPPNHDNWEWDGVSVNASNARQSIVGKLEALGLPDWQNWFCLWIPLRQKRHCEEVFPIVKNYPGDESCSLESIFPLNSVHEISRTFPMLRHLNSVSAWNLGTDGSSEMLFQVNLAEGATRCRYRSREQGISTRTHADQPALKGTVKVREQSKMKQCLYAGLEQTLDRPIFDQLRRSEYWPTVVGIDSSGAGQQDRENADPHCAVYFVDTPAEQEGVLKFQHSVFLPVGDPKENISCPGESDFTLMLHGYFFPNAGRTQIEIPNDNEEEISDNLNDLNSETGVRLRWNYELFVSGTLPLVIPASNQFAKEANLSEEKVRRLTEALAKSDTFSQYRKSICAAMQWVWRLTASGTAWEMDSPHEEILEIPPPPNSAPNRPDEVFPNLREIASEHVITFSDAPRLTLQEQASRWPPELLMQMLHAVRVEVAFENRSMLKYLARFLKACTQNARSDVLDAIQGLMSEAFNRLGLGQLRNNRTEIRNFLANLGSGSCFPIPKDIFEEVFQELVQSELHVLLIPKDLISGELHQLLTESLCNEDAVKILKFISNLADNRELNIPEETLVKQVIAASRWDEIQAECDSLNIFTAYDCREKRDVPVSLSRLKELKREDMLYAGRSTSTQAMHLQQALHRESVYLIQTERETRTTLGLDDITPCNEGACLLVLQSRPALKQPEERVNLLKALLPQDGNLPDECIPAFRYLIHAHPSDENQPLFMEANAGPEIWSKMASKILRLKNEQWRVMPNALGVTIPLRLWAPLGIHALDAAAITQLIREVGSERVSCTGFSADERQQILQHINDPEILRGLQIYHDVDGNLVRIKPECTYWQADFPIEDMPRENITILRPLPQFLRVTQEHILDRFFTAEVAIHVLLETENPHQHWTLILNAVDHLNSVPSELKQKLRAAQWLPVVGAGRSPQDVIYIEDMEDEVSQIVTQFGDSSVDVSMLPEKFRAHPGYKRTVRDIFPKRDDALEMLGLMMAESEKYRIGEIDTLDLDLKMFLATFENDPLQMMPSHSVLQAVCETFDENVCSERLLPQLCQRLPITHTVEILSFLASHHKAAPRNRKSNILDIFNLYLKSATRAPEFRANLRQIPLLSRDGNWKLPAELCLDLEGIHPDDLLDEKQSEVLINRVQTSENRGRTQSHESLPPHGNEQQQFDESAARLEQYFNAWHGVVQDEVMGGLLALLGNHRTLLRLSDQYLGNHSVQWFRAQLDSNWEVKHESSAVGARENINQTMTHQRFLVKVVEGETINVTNLLGCPFDARIEQEDFDSLLIGRANEQFSYVSGMNHRANWIHLRLIHPEQFSRDRLLNLIKASACLLLKEVYQQTIQNLDEVFDDLAQAEQLDIRIAQNLLLNAAFFYVQQLEMRDMDSNLSTILQKWDEARRRQAEGEHTDNTGLANEAAGELQQEQQELQNLIQSDESAQHSLLTAVRRKIEDHYQYKPQSVPFEIFQNADDAVVELLEMRGNSHSDNRDETRFVVQQEDDRIAFIHWGRPINKFRSALIDDAQSRKFKRDLEKMLILSNSDKSQSTETVTGKFGLGFKSVFLVTSKPRVASGQLGFEAVSGFFPKQLTGEPLRELQRQIETCQIDGREGTIISLQAEECSVQECLKEFWDVVHFIPVFAKRIRICDWITDAQTKSWEWNDRPLTQSKGVCVGEIQPKSDGQRGRQTVVVFRAGQGDLLVGLDAHGAVKLEESVPTIWVTVPTKEKCDLGFIVNGKLDLDVGRAQLARGSEENTKVADRIGRDVGSLMIELFDKANGNWSDFCDNLNLSGDANQYQFWNSMWRLFSMGIRENLTNPTEAIQLAHRVLWNSSEHGMGKLFQQRPAIPSGLRGDYETLTKLGQIQFKTVGVLDTDESVFCKACQWPQFRGRILPGRVVSDEKIASVMMRLLPSENVNVQEVRIHDLIQWELGSDRCIDASQASQLGSLITREFLSDLQRGNQNQQNEYDELVELLSNIRFRGSDGEFHAAVDLLIKGEGADNSDEPLRAAFAPADRLLADDYTGSALEFFKACRQELRAPSQLLTKWALQASGDQTRRAVLQYILEGELGRQISSEIQKRIEGTWLSNLSESPLVTNHFDCWQRSKILIELRLYDGGTDPPPIPPVVHRDPSFVLEDVREWWIQEGDSHISRYEQSVYGDFRLRLSNQPDWEDPQMRESWLTLLILGAFHTMGRVRPEQNRSIITQWRNEGWLQTFAQPQVDSERWVEFLRNFLNQSGETIEYFHWSRQFVSIFQFAERLEVYGDALLHIDRLSAPFSMTHITRLGYSSQFQGSGSDLDAPSIDRTLGIGACFVVRELMRLEILSSEHAYSHCYTPVSRVRKLLESIGCRDLDMNSSQGWEQSVTIYEFLRGHLEERAIFNKAFDIPFLIIAENQDLQQQFFGGHILQNEDNEEAYE